MNVCHLGNIRMIIYYHVHYRKNIHIYFYSRPSRPFHVHFPKVFSPHLDFFRESFSSRFVVPCKKSTAAVHTNCITVTLKLSMMYFPLTFMADWTGTLCYCRHLLAFLYLWTGKIHWESQSEQFIPLPMYKYYHPSCQCHVTIMIIT